MKKAAMTQVDAVLPAKFRLDAKMSLVPVTTQRPRNKCRAKEGLFTATKKEAAAGGGGGRKGGTATMNTSNRQYMASARAATKGGGRGGKEGGERGPLTASTNKDNVGDKCEQYGAATADATKASNLGPSERRASYTSCCQRKATIPTSSSMLNLTATTFRDKLVPTLSMDSMMRVSPLPPPPPPSPPRPAGATPTSTTLTATPRRKLSRTTFKSMHEMRETLKQESKEL